MRRNTIANILLTGIITIVCVNCEFKDKNERVVLVAPVYAPYRTSRGLLKETAKDFPRIRLLSTHDDTAVINKVEYRENLYEKPVYVVVSMYYYLLKSKVYRFPIKEV